MDKAPGGQNDPDTPTAVAPEVPGYHCERLLGTGGSAAVWLMRDGQGNFSALKVLNPMVGMDPGVAVARREELLLARFTHEHLLVVREVIDTGQGTALRMDYAPGGSLLNLVSVRGPLPPGEVVTVLTPLAQALAYLHDGGAIHGDVSPGNILFTELGKPLLADLGIGRLLGEGSRAPGGTPGFRHGSAAPGRLNTEGDIYALAAVGWFALTGRVPGPAIHRPPLSLLVPDTPEGLAELLCRGLDEDAGVRPTARQFAREVQRTAPAEPIDLVAAVHPAVLPSLRTRHSAPADSATRRRRRRRFGPRRRPANHRPGRRASAATVSRSTVAAVAVVIVTALLLTGPMTAPLTGLWGGEPRDLDAGGAGTVSSASSPPPPTTPDGGEPTGDSTAAKLPTSALAGQDPLTVLPHLSVVRQRAFETADPQLLTLVNVPQSTAMASDEDAVSRLAARGHVLEGLRIVLSNLEPAEIPAGSTAAPPDLAAIEATATTSGYSEVSAGGRVHRSDPESVSQRLVFVLQKIDDRWLILEVYEA